MSASEIRHVMLGKDHERYGAYGLAQVSANTVAAMSVGSDEKFASDHPKQHPNEDALLVIEDKRRTVLCVADAHYGRESSEELIVLLRELFKPVPGTPEELDVALRNISREKRTGRHMSETTLLIAIYDRLFRQGFGLSFGDSSLVLARPRSLPEKQNRKNKMFVSMTEPKSLRPSNADHIHFSAAPGDLLIAYTDGIDECCYREPDRGVTPPIMQMLVDGRADDPKGAAEAIVGTALKGVGGWAGGQDNIALIVSKI